MVLGVWVVGCELFWGGKVFGCVWSFKSGLRASRWIEGVGKKVGRRCWVIEC